MFGHRLTQASSSQMTEYHDPELGCEFDDMDNEAYYRFVFNVSVYRPVMAADSLPVSNNPSPPTHGDCRGS